MNPAAAPLRRWSVIASFGLLAGCASIIGVDELAYDLPAGGDGGAGPSSTAPASNGSSTSTGDAPTTTSSSTASGSSSSSNASSSSGSDGGGGHGEGGGSGGSESGSGGEGGAGGAGGNPPTGFVVTGDRDGYTDYLTRFNDGKNVDVAIWHLDEGAGARANDGGEGHFDGAYLPEGGTLTYGEPGVFADDHAVRFAGGARVHVEDEGFYYYGFQLRYADYPFALMFFAKVDEVPEEPIVVASCIGEDGGRETGWRVKLKDKVTFEQHGSDFWGEDVDETTIEADFPADGAWHFVVLTRQDADSGEVRLYVDGALETADTDVAEYFQYFGKFSFGAEAGEADAGAVTLDEVAFFDEQINNEQVLGLIHCLQGETCIPPGN